MKEKYSNKLQEAIVNCKIKHEKRNQVILPNQLKLSISKIASRYILPSAFSLKDDINLDKNIFDSINLSENQIKSLEELRLRIRDYNIQKLEQQIQSYSMLKVFRQKPE